MLTFEQIKELIDQVARLGLTSFELERSGFRLRIDGQKVERESIGPVQPAAPVSTEGPPSLAESVPAPAAATPARPPEAAPEDHHVLHSPIVGTFYRAPNPDSTNYVEIGDRVKKGQVLCIVEAMKLMNEIESDIDGVITEIYTENAQPVEYGESLFVIKKG